MGRVVSSSQLYLSLLGRVVELRALPNMRASYNTRNIPLSRLRFWDGEVDRIGTRIGGGVVVHQVTPRILGLLVDGSTWKVELPEGCQPLADGDTWQIIA